MVLQKDGEDELDRSCEKRGSITQSRGKTGGGVSITGGHEKRRKQLLDGLEETKGYWKLKEEALDRTL